MTLVSGEHTVAAKADMQSNSIFCIFGITNHLRQYWVKSSIEKNNRVPFSMIC